MGAALATRIAEGPHVGLRYGTKLVLIRMALTALDSDPEPAYWAGWQPLAQILDLVGTDETNRRRIRERIAELHDAGAVTRTKRGHNGSNAVYRLWLDAPAPLGDNGRHPDCVGCRGVRLGHEPHAVAQPHALGRGPPGLRALGAHRMAQSQR